MGRYFSAIFLSIKTVVSRLGKEAKGPETSGTFLTTIPCSPDFFSDVFNIVIFRKYTTTATATATATTRRQQQQ